MSRHRKANSFPDLATKGDPRLLSSIERRTPGVAGGGINHFFGSTVITVPRKAKKAAARKIICPFGEIITYYETEEGESGPTQKTGIRGGYISAGDKTWNVDPRPINLAASGEFLIWLKIIVTVNTDSENIATLSGVKTSEQPTWENGSGSDDYEEKIIPAIFPTSSPGMGKLIIPVGVLTIADGAAKLESAGCGNIFVTHCPGTLHFNRTGGTDDSSGS